MLIIVLILQYLKIQSAQLPKTIIIATHTHFLKRISEPQRNFLRDQTQ